MIGQWLIVAGAYLFGSLPTAFLVVKWVTGTDIRLFGSGNVGGTNAVRAVGLRIGILVTLVDMAKGAVPVLVMHWYDPASRWLALAMLAAVIGHIFPVWLRFRGGKGVATGFGAFLVLSPAVAGAALVLWIAMVAIWRYVALASMVATACFPVVLYLMEHPPNVVMWAIVGVSVLIVAKHRNNMENLVNGKEPRIGFEKWDDKR